MQIFLFLFAYFSSGSTQSFAIAVMSDLETHARQQLAELAAKYKLDVAGGKVSLLMHRWTVIRACRRRSQEISSADTWTTDSNLTHRPQHWRHLASA